MFRVRQLPNMTWSGFELLKVEHCTKGRSQGGPQNPRALNAWAVPGQGGWCSGGYIVTHEGARRLREAQTPVWALADGVFRLWPFSSNFRVFHTLPPLAWQNETLSSEIGFRRNGSQVGSFSRPSE